MRTDLLFYAIVMVASAAAFALLVPPMGFAPDYGPIDRCEDIAMRDGLHSLPTTCKVRPARTGVLA